MAGKNESSDALSTPPDPDPRLSLVSRLVETLVERNIAYCHWKSNEHLEAAVRGGTDLDLLFLPGAEDDTRAALRDCGFFLCHSPWYRRYASIEDWLGVDEATGTLVHAHVHFRLVLGRGGVKGHRVPWEHATLRDRIWDPTWRIHRSDPATEALLLLVREGIKAGDAGGEPSDDAIREFDWLRERSSLEEITARTQRYFASSPEIDLTDLWNRGLTRERLGRFHAAISTDLARLQHLQLPATLARAAAQRLMPGVARLARLTGLRDLATRRIPAQRGLIIAVLGSDGCGKSTLTATLRHRLASKLDILGLYMGSAPNQASGIRRVLLRARAWIGEGVATAPRTGMRAHLHDIERIFWSLVAGLDRLRLLRRADRARRNGLIVVCDRYPQASIQGYNDGPALGITSRHALLRWLGRLERSWYQSAARYAPDVVIKLHGSLDVLTARRPEMSADEIQLKQDGILALPFPESTHVALISADESAAVVAARAMTLIGDAVRTPGSAGRT